MYANVYSFHLILDYHLTTKKKKKKNRKRNFTSYRNRVNVRFFRKSYPFESRILKDITLNFVLYISVLLYIHFIACWITQLALVHIYYIMTHNNITQQNKKGAGKGSFSADAKSFQNFLWIFFWLFFFVEIENALIRTR